MHDTIILTLLALSLVFLGGISNRRHAGMLEQLNRLTQQVTHLLEITESRPEVSSQKRRTLATVIFNDPNCPKPPDEAIY